MKITEPSRRSRRAARRRRRPTFLQNHPLLFYAILAIIILAALNFALLLPTAVASIFYEIEQFFIRLFLLPITLNRIELFILLAIVAAISYFFVPIVWIPSTGEAFIYRGTYSDGKLRYFKKLNGKIIAINEKWPAKKWLKYVVMGRIESISENNDILIYESKDLEVTQSLLDKSYVEALQERIAALEDEIATAREIFRQQEEQEEE